MQKILIDRPEEYQAQIGEVLEFHFKLISMPLLQKWQMDKIVAKLNASEKFRVMRIDKQNGDLIILVKVVSNPLPLWFVVTAVGGVLSLFFIRWSLGTVYKIVEEPNINVMTLGAAGIGILVGIVMLFTMLRKG